MKSSAWQAKFKIGSRWVRTTTKLDDLEKAKDLFTEYKFKEKHELPVITKRFMDVAEHFDRGKPQNRLSEKYIGKIAVRWRRPLA